VPFARTLTPIKKTSTAKYRISNIEPKKSDPDFDIHYSIFDILLFKRILYIDCGRKRYKK